MKSILDELKADPNFKVINRSDSYGLHLLAAALMQEAMDKDDINYLKDNYYLWFNKFVELSKLISDINLKIAERVQAGEEFNKVYTEEHLKD